MKDVILVTNVEGSSKHAIHEDAEATLEKLHSALAKDDSADIHKNILYENVLKNQLIPLLLAVRVETQPRLLSLIIRQVRLYWFRKLYQNKLGLSWAKLKLSEKL